MGWAGQTPRCADLHHGTQSMHTSRVCHGVKAAILWLHRHRLSFLPKSWAESRAFMSITCAWYLPEMPLTMHCAKFLLPVSIVCFICMSWSAVELTCIIVRTTHSSYFVWVSCYVCFNLSHLHSMPLSCWHCTLAVALHSCPQLSQSACVHSNI